MVEPIIYLCLCMVAVLFACGFPQRERLAAMPLGAALIANWIFCQWTYADNPPQALLHISAASSWALADFLFGIAVTCIARDFTFGKVLFCLALMQELCHFAFSLGWWSSGNYLDVLDALLLAMIAVFIAGGWKGVQDAAVDTFWHPNSRELRSWSVQTREAGSDEA